MGWPGPELSHQHACQSPSSGHCARRLRSGRPVQEWARASGGSTGHVLPPPLAQAHALGSPDGRLWLWAPLCGASAVPLCPRCLTSTGHPGRSLPGLVPCQRRQALVRGLGPHRQRGLSAPTELNGAELKDCVSNHSLSSNASLPSVQSCRRLRERRVASWAVSFERLLQDPLGVRYFSVSGRAWAQRRSLVKARRAGPAAQGLGAVPAAAARGSFPQWLWHVRPRPEREGGEGRGSRGGGPGNTDPLLRAQGDVHNHVF